MFINPEDAGQIRSVKWLSEEKEKEKEKENAIYSFLQGAVYCWCNNNPNGSPCEISWEVLTLTGKERL